MNINYRFRLTVIRSAVFVHLVLSVSLAAAQDISSNLVAHWTLDDGSGTTALDATINSYDGTLNGNPTWQSSAKLASGLDFETTDGVDRIDAGTFDLTGSGVTLAAWIKPENGFSDGRLIFKSIDNSAPGQLWGITCENANSIDFRIQAGGTWNLLEVPGAVTAGHWYHVVSTYDGTTLRIYVDGVEVGNLVHSVGGAVDTNASTQVTLGDSPVGGRPFDGQIDDARVYDRALTAADVTALFNNGWGSRNLLLVTQNNGTLTAQERLRKKQFEDWDYKVSTVWSGDSQAAFDTALAGIDVAYISDQASAFSIVHKVRETTVGVVSESQCLTDKMGFSTSVCWSSTSTTTVSIVDNTHYITKGFSTGSLTIFLSSQIGIYLAGTPAADLVPLADISSSTSLSVVNVGGTLATTYNSSNLATGRRVQLPFGSGAFDFASLNADGLTIIQRSLEWAAGGLVGHWKLDEASGTTAADSSYFNNDGTYTNGPVLAQTARYGYGSDFDGSDDRVVVADDSSLQMTSVVTMAAWVNPVQSGNAEMMIINKEGEYEMALTNTGELKWAYKNTDPGWSWHYTGAIVPDGQWSHVAVTYSEGTIKTYFNGVLVDTYNGSGTIGDQYPTYNELWIGGRSNNPTGASFGGLIDDARVYRQELTAAEVAALYDLHGHWRLDENSGTAAADSSPQGYDGTYTNSPTLGAGGAYPGDVLTAVEFDGIDDRVALPTTNSDFTEGLTISLWAKPSAIPTPFAPMVSFSNGILVDDIWFGWQPSYGLEIFLSDPVSGAANTFAADYIEMQVGVWEHCVVTIDAAGNAKLYRNGVETASGFTSRPTNVTRTQNYIGHSVFNDPFPGTIDDVRLYNRPLTAAEVSELFGLTGHWKMDEGAGSTAADSTGFSNDATLSGATWTTDCAGNNGLAFDGISHTATTNSDFDPPATGTVAVWLRSAGNPGARSRPFGVGGNWEIRQESDGTLSFDLGGEGPDEGAGPDEFVTNEGLSFEDRWYHLVAHFDASDDSFEVHINGALVHSGTNGDDMTKQLANILSFGTRTGSSENWEGGMRDFRVYNRWLSGSEISNLSGLVGYWKLDETSGTLAVDSSSAGNDGTYTNGVTLNQSGNINLAADFDGLDDYVAIADNASIQMDNTFSMSAWIRADSSSNVNQMILNKEGEYEIALFPGGVLYWAVKNTDPGWSWHSTGHVVAIGKWTHIAMTYDNGTVSTYANGVLVDTYSGSGAIGDQYTSLNELRIGGRSNNPSGKYFDGRLDDIRVFIRVLCPVEVFGQYRGGRPAGIRILQWVETR